MHRLVLITIIFMVVVPGRVLGQYYVTGQDPASLKWNSIRTDHFIFIYPTTYETQIPGVVYSFEEAYRLLKGRYSETSNKPLPVIIHNHSVESNGFVAWAPKRVELFPLPEQDNIPLDHIEQLALHELLHMVQMQGLVKGVSRPLSFILGEQYTGALAVYTPLWFLEGEAVVSESIFSNSGRGRTPAFEKRLKAILLEEDEIPGYYKMINGSLKDYLPNHYEYGYQMTAWARANLDDNVWNEAVNYTAKRPYSLNPFNLSLRKYSGMTKKKLYYETMTYLKNKWFEEEKSIEFTDYDTISPTKRDRYINYLSPVIVGKDSIIAIRSSLHDVPRFVLIDRFSKTEKIIHTPGYVWPFKLSYARGIVTWAENRDDPRWSAKGYSIIKTYNIGSGMVKVLSTRSRYFSPDISPDGEMIVVSESTVDFKNRLLILDAFNGSIIKQFDTPDNILVVQPSWSDDMKEIVFISYSDKGEGIMSLKSESGIWEVLLPPARQDLQSVRMNKKQVYFVSSNSGSDNIYCLDNNGLVYQVNSSRFGVKDVYVKNNTILFSDYTSHGNVIGSTALNTRFRETNITTIIPKLEYDGINSPDKFLTMKIPELDAKYEVKPYRKGLHLFNFHSWMPFYMDIDDFSSSSLLPVRLGATLMSQNHLNSLVTTLGYEYSQNNHFLHTKISWQGWYPAFDLDVSYGGDPRIIQDQDSNAEPSIIYPGINLSLYAYLPLRFSWGRFSQTVWPSVRLRYINDYIFDNETNLFDYGQTQVISRLYLSNFHRMSARDIWPRWGQVFDYYHSFSPTDGDLYSSASTLRTALYLPGIIRNHGLMLRYESEKQEFKRIILFNRVRLPRGINHIISEDLKTFSADYTFPFAYLDLNLLNTIYIQRLRNTFFIDYSAGQGNYHIKEDDFFEGNENFSSFGTELVIDFYALVLPFKFSTGVQAAWLPGTQEPYFNFLFNIDIFGFVIGKDKHPY